MRGDYPALCFRDRRQFLADMRVERLELCLIAAEPLLVGLGMLLAGIAAYLSTKFLMKYFETGRLNPFAYYCWGAGIISLILLIFVLHRTS